MNNSAVTTLAAQAGGGRIELKVGDMIYLRGSEVSTSVQGGTDTAAGNISIDPRFLILDGSSILAQAAAGRGGNITIVADNLIISPDSVISASSQTGISGIVAVSSPEVDLTSGLQVLPTAYVDPATRLQPSCAARGAEGLSRLERGPRGGLPPSPDGYLMSSYAPAEAEPSAAAGLPGYDIAAAGGSASFDISCAPSR